MTSSGNGSTMVPVDPRAPHVAPVNDLVDKLRRGGVFVPYAHQNQGGVHAPVLSVLRDPGDATQVTQVLCADHPDPTSRRQRELMAQVGLTMTDICPWNAHPWMLPGREPSVEDVAAGAVVLADLLGMMTNLRVLLLQGEHARWAWAMVSSFRPRYARPIFEVVTTCHPLGTRGRTPEETARRRADQLTAWQQVAKAVRS